MNISDVMKVAETIEAGKTGTQPKPINPRLPLDEQAVNELTAIRVELRDAKQGIALISNQVQYLTQLCETIVEDAKPCAEEQANRNESLEGIMQMLKDSPLNKHPMFKDLLKPLGDMLEKQKA